MTDGWIGDQVKEWKTDGALDLGTSVMDGRVLFGQMVVEVCQIDRLVDEFLSLFDGKVSSG